MYGHTHVATVASYFNLVKPHYRGTADDAKWTEFKRKLHRTIVVDVFENNTTASQQFVRHAFAHVSAVVTSSPHTYGVGGSLLPNAKELETILEFKDSANNRFVSLNIFLYLYLNRSRK